MAGTPEQFSMPPPPPKIMRLGSPNSVTWRRSLRRRSSGSYPTRAAPGKVMLNPLKCPIHSLSAQPRASSCNRRSIAGSEPRPRTPVGQTMPIHSRRVLLRDGPIRLAAGPASAPRMRRMPSTSTVGKSLSRPRISRHRSRRSASVPNSVLTSSIPWKSIRTSPRDRLLLRSLPPSPTSPEASLRIT